jgi:hypothetical protein
MNEITYAFRTLKNTPSFAAVAILTLALGVGANTAMFSVVNGVLLRPLGYPNASRIVSLNTSQRGRAFPRMTGPDFVDVRADASTLEQVAFYYGGDMGVQMADRAEFAATYLVTANFFPVFGTALAFGRAFDESDARRGAIVGLPFSAARCASKAPRSRSSASRLRHSVFPATRRSGSRRRRSPRAWSGPRSTTAPSPWCATARRSMRPTPSWRQSARGSRRRTRMQTGTRPSSPCRCRNSSSAPCAPRCTS